MALSDNLSDIVQRLDWIAGALEATGIECSDLDDAAADLNEIRLQIEREAFAAHPAMVVA
jgi:hypothetical protein